MNKQEVVLNKKSILGLIRCEYLVPFDTGNGIYFDMRGGYIIEIIWREAVFIASKMGSLIHR